MQTFAAAMSVVLPLAFAGEGPALAAAIPAGVFPEITIRKGEAPHEWPFSVNEGKLTCVEYGGRQTVIFTEPWRTDVPQEFGNMTPPRSVIVSVDPFALLASHEDRDLYLPFDSLETLIKRLAPFETMGRALCAGGPPQEKEI
jgi:hypothetical protein